VIFRDRKPFARKMKISDMLVYGRPSIHSFSSGGTTPRDSSELEGPANASRLSLPRGVPAALSFDNIVNGHTCPVGYFIFKSNGSSLLPVRGLMPLLKTSCSSLARLWTWLNLFLPVSFVLSQFRDLLYLLISESSILWP